MRVHIFNTERKTIKSSMMAEMNAISTRYEERTREKQDFTVMMGRRLQNVNAFMFTDWNLFLWYHLTVQASQPARRPQVSFLPDLSLLYSNRKRVKHQIHKHPISLPLWRNNKLRG